MTTNELIFAQLAAMFNQYGYSAAFQNLWLKFHNSEISKRDYEILVDALNKLKG